MRDEQDGEPHLLLRRLERAARRPVLSAHRNAASFRRRPGFALHGRPKRISCLHIRQGTGRPRQRFPAATGHGL